MANITLSANGKSYIRLTPTIHSYSFSDIEVASPNDLYVIRESGNSSPGLETVASAPRTFAQLIETGEIALVTTVGTETYYAFAGDTPLIVLRITPVDALVTFQASSGVNEEDLNLALTQARLVAQEAAEYRERSGLNGRQYVAESLGVYSGASFVTEDGTVWNFQVPGGIAGSVASEYLVFVDGQYVPTEYFASIGPSVGNNGAFQVNDSDYPSPSTWRIIYLGDYISASLEVPAGSITADKIANNSVDTPAIAAGAVTTDKLEDASVTAAKLAPGAVSSTVTTEGTKITGDGTVGTPVTLAEYSRFGLSAAALVADTPGSEDWAVYSRTTAGITYENGVTLNIGGSTVPSSRVWQLANRDIYFVAQQLPLGSWPNASTRLLIASDSSGAGAKNLLRNTSVKESDSYLAGIIPKGVYYNIQLDTTLPAGTTITQTVYLFPMDHRPTA